MPDYKRLVSYMYNYEDGTKRNNVGYARVETRNGQCKYTIHITAPSLNERQLKVYLFRREAENMEGILLGTFQIKNGNGDFKAITEAVHINKTPYGLDDMSGIVLYFTERKFFATEWDSKPVTMSKVFAMDRREVKRAEQASVVVDAQADIKAAGVAGVLVPPREEVKDKTDNVIAFKKDNLEKEKVHTPTSDKPLNDEPLNDLLTPNLKHVIDSANISLEEDLLSRELLENNKDLLQNNTVEQPVNEVKVVEERKTLDNETAEKDAKIEISDSIANETPPDDSKIEENLAENLTGNLAEEKETASISFEDHPIAKQIYKSFPRMYPFEDNEIAWSARIEPKDIGLLPTDFWGLGNNSFLLHGYYSYRHLIFARTNDKNGYSYILGVPGIYHNREKFMAKMFGFENFKCTKRKTQRTGEFGYWYIPIILN